MPKVNIQDWESYDDKLNVDINEFIRKNTQIISDNIENKKQLLQEDK